MSIDGQTKRHHRKLAQTQKIHALWSEVAKQNAFAADFLRSSMSSVFAKSTAGGWHCAGQERAQTIEHQVFERDGNFFISFDFLHLPSQASGQNYALSAFDGVDSAWVGIPNDQALAAIAKKQSLGMSPLVWLLATSPDALQRLALSLPGLGDFLLARSQAWALAKDPQILPGNGAGKPRL